MTSSEEQVQVGQVLRFGAKELPAEFHSLLQQKNQSVACRFRKAAADSSLRIPAANGLKHLRNVSTKAEIRMTKEPCTKDNEPLEC